MPLCGNAVGPRGEQDHPFTVWRIVKLSNREVIPVAVNGVLIKIKAIVTVSGRGLALVGPQVRYHVAVDDCFHRFIPFVIVV